MDHAAATQLDPSSTFAGPASRSAAYKAAKVEFSRRLGEGEVGRAKSSSQLRPEHQLDELLHGTLQVRHRDSAVDIEAFELKKHRIVCWIRSVPAKDAARRYNPERRLPALHSVYLDGRSLAPQCKTLGEVECIGGVTGRMAGRNIEGVKVVIRSLDLRAVLDRIAH